MARAGIVRTHSVVSLLCLTGIVAAVCVAALFLRTSTASAGSGSNCPTKTFCLYSGTNFDGTVYPFSSSLGQDQWLLTNYFYPGSAGVASSAYNNRDHITSYSDYVYTPIPASNKACMNPGGQRLNLGNWFYHDGDSEWHNVYSFDMSYSGTVCSNP
jgi:peptidase inhibitor family I36